MKYNTALDFMALALSQAKAGNHEIAAKCLIQASREQDADKALQIIEHSNGVAAKALVAAHTKAKAAKAVKAEAEEIEFDESLLDEDLRDDAGEAEDDAGAEVDAAAEDDEAEGEEDAGEAEAMEVMASFFAKAAKHAKAAKAKRK